jgi:4-hydroxy-2-oxoglutarate aldolase
MKLQGIFVDMATPFDHEGRLYRSKIQYNVSKYCRTTISGLIAGGAAGEGPLLSFDEKRELFQLVKQATEGERILLAGVDCAGVAESVALAQVAADAGFDLIAAYPPRFDGRMDACVEVKSLYFRTLADRSALPVVLVNDGMPAGALGHSNIVATIESEPDRVKEFAGAGRRVLCGSEPVLLESLKNGASGGTLAFASAAPYAAIAIWEAFRTREEEAGIDWQDRIRIPSELIRSRYGVAALKKAMDRNGYYGGNPRLPLRPLSVKEQEEVDTAFEHLEG